MFLLSPQTKVFLAKQVTDMRKSFRGLPRSPRPCSAKIRSPVIFLCLSIDGGTC
jgi:hypothetical protein